MTCSRTEDRRGRDTEEPGAPQVPAQAPNSHRLARPGACHAPQLAGTRARLRRVAPTPAPSPAWASVFLFCGTEVPAAPPASPKRCKEVREDLENNF